MGCCDVYRATKVRAYSRSIQSTLEHLSRLFLLQWSQATVEELRKTNGTPTVSTSQSDHSLKELSVIIITEPLKTGSSS